MSTTFTPEPPARPPLPDEIAVAYSTDIVRGSVSSIIGDLVTIAVDEILKGESGQVEVTFSQASSGRRPHLGDQGVWLLDNSEPRVLLAGGPNGPTAAQVRSILSETP